MAFKSYFLLSIIPLLFLTGLTQAAEEPTLSSLVEAVRSDQGEYSAAWSDMRERLMTGQVYLTAEGIDQFNELLVEIVLAPGAGSRKNKAKGLLLRFPHEDVGQQLTAYLKENPDDPFGLSETIMVLLARLHDDSVLDLLVAELQHGNKRRVRKAISSLVELGNAKAIKPLNTLWADTALTARFVDFAIERGGKERTERVIKHQRKFTEYDVSEIRKAAEIGARQLQFHEDSGITCGFDLPQKAMDLLASQGAVVMPWTQYEMFQWYDAEYPFVTTDFVYHTYMILVRAAIDELENLLLKQDLGTLAFAWSKASLNQAAKLSDDGMRDLALDNAALLAVPSILCNGLSIHDLDDLGFDPERRSHVEAELARVREASYMGASPLLGVMEDYTEYRPRGRISNAEKPGFFQGHTWLARAVFPIDDLPATKRALLLVHALLADAELQRLWLGLDSAIGFLAGPLDDPDVRMYLELAEKVSGQQGTDALMAVFNDAGNLKSFQKLAAQWPAPRINTGMDGTNEEPMGLHIMGQRYSIDAHLFQKLMDKGQWPVSGLQVIAGFPGSVRAAEHLKASSQERLLFSLEDLPDAGDPGLMNGFYYTHQPLFEPQPNVPELYTTKVWQDKKINAALGGWAETRHAAAPYLKSARVSLGLSSMTDRFHGYAEPNPQFYGRLKGQAQAWHELFEQLGLYNKIDEQILATHAELDEKFGKPNKFGTRKALGSYDKLYKKELELFRLDRTRLPEFMTILDVLVDLSERELKQQGQTPQDGVFLKGLGFRLKRLGYNYSSGGGSEKPMSRIMDVATEYWSGEVLEAGVGQAMAIFVAVPDSDRVTVCRGAVYSYYEKVLPVSKRMDDSIWQSISSAGTFLDEGSWLAKNSELMYQPFLTRDEVEALSNYTVEQPRFQHPYPWHPRGFYHDEFSPWSGTRTRACDVDLLLELTAQSNLDSDLFVYVHRQLASHADQPEVLKFWRDNLDGFVKGSSDRKYIHTDSGAVQLFWGSQVLGMHGDVRDVNLLVLLANNMDGFQHNRVVLREPLEWLLGDALRKVRTTH